MHDVACEINPATGEFAYSTVVVIVQRQAGKTALFHPLATHRALTGFDRLCWYTAQSRQDARDNLMSFVPLLRRSPLASLIKVRESQGSEGISFATGSSYRIFSPVPDALHGKANALVGLDEGWAYDEALGDALVQAIVPTFSTVDGQLWIVSAAGTAASVWLRSYVESGRATVDAGRTNTLAYFEFGIPDDADPADLSAIAAAHPAYGYTLRPAALEAAQATMKPGEFARAYGNRWTGIAERVIAEPLWRAAQAKVAIGESLPQPPAGGVVLAFECGLDQTDASIVAVWRDALGIARVELLDVRPGTSWVTPRLVELVDTWRPLAIGHDGGGPAAHIVDECRRTPELVSYLQPTPTPAYCAACAGFLTGLAGGRILIHTHQALDDAAAAAAKRLIGDGGWGWGRRASGATIAPLVAATIGLWIFDHAPPPFEIH